MIGNYGLCSSTFKNLAKCAYFTFWYCTITFLTDHTVLYIHIHTNYSQENILISLLPNNKRTFLSEKDPALKCDWPCSFMLLIHKKVMPAICSVSSLLYIQHAELLTEVLTEFHWREKQREQTTPMLLPCWIIDLLTHDIHYVHTDTQRKAAEKHHNLFLTLFWTLKQRCSAANLPHLPALLLSITARSADLTFMCVWTANSEADQ